ncbi:MinD-like ATPase involved in chromosome partitioning or flagellar assembly [Ruminiclostridium sufflavum DSM 19573]|uniref:MinD-like ATPase involved in chromosome partitioning or flagellar assembly n=1 Tax=Ruminiclostridium sufflavum DSM 19573 TaxID=1121337 RepID=A0A318XNE1_9FIRM|nr:AAA family ATPase [Ruminiclostridium sufflavum]PYG88459.1 MinD-like ATPase involved in chromosome partitioning or flagellar assembly [Ruminiclostridium sufflavum DSM 19573]
MALIRLIIFDDDNEYSFSLCNFLTHNFSETLLVNYYNNSYKIEDWIKKIEPDIILVCEKYYNQVCNQFKANLIILTTGTTKNEDLADVPSIYKYQDANRIAGSIINIYTKSNNIITQKKEKEAKTVAVYSAAGNTGKTSVAVGISTICSSLGMSVFYLNLELFSSASIFFCGNNDYSIADIIYYAKEKDNNLLSKITTMSCKDISSNIHYFKEANNAFEINEIQPQDIELIINTIKSSGLYDLIVIDMDSQLNDNTTAIFKITDEILCIFTNEEICLHKTQLFVESINKLSESFTQNTFLTHKLLYVANKVSKQALLSHKTFLNNKSLYSLPYDGKFNSLKKLIKSNGGPELFKNSVKDIAARYIK